MLTTAELNTILGRRLSGTTQLIRGVAEPAIGRIGRVTCRYGITATAAGGPTAGRVPALTPPGGPSPTTSAAASPAASPPTTGGVPIEIGLSTYRDPDSASQRINFTIHDQEAKGAVATDATILDLDGVLLTSAKMALLALSYGSLTLALSIDPRVVPTGQVGRVAAAIGKAVLRNLRDNGDSSGDLGGGPSRGGGSGASTGVPE
ncbi:MAG TPA: hypothetical protein VFX70_08405 [Mycobacteriales bacterium]|nr:hypothetical protein [Mycobacteriales bacterium]